MDYSAKIEFIIVVGTFCILTLVTFIIMFMVLYQKKRLNQQVTIQKVEAEYRHQLLATAIDIQESERKRIALDLHDNIGSLLSAIRLKIHQINKNASHTSVQELSKETIEIVDDMIYGTRSFSRELMPPTLEDFGLVHALENLCSRIHSEDTLQVDFHVEGEYKRLELKSELNVFRIAQEVTNNIVKHANATIIHLTLACNNNIELQIEDNGDGFAPRSIKDITNTPSIAGLGLKSIETRLHLLKASIEYIPMKTRGSKVIVRIPAQE